MKTGADILLSLVNAAVSDTVRDGIRLDADDTTWYSHAHEAVAYASGRALAGDSALVWLDTWSLRGVTDQVRAAVERQLPVVVVVTSPVARSGNMLPLLDAGCPVLTPSSAQEVIDFAVIGRDVALRTSGPVVVLADGRTTIWTTAPVLAPVATGTERSAQASIWTDTSHPKGLGLPVPPALRLKQNVGRYVVRTVSALAVIEEAMERFAEKNGRSWAILRPPSGASEKNDVAFIAQGSSSGNVWSLACVRPFPTDAVKNALSPFRIVGVLETANQADLQGQSLIQHVRAAVDPVPVDAPHHFLWNRGAALADRAVVPVLLAAHSVPSPAGLSAAARTLAAAPSPGPVVVDSMLTALDIRIPDVEWTVQRMKAEGLDFSTMEIPSHGPQPPCLLVLGGTARDVWADMEVAVRHLGQDTHHGRFHALTDGAGSPVLGRVDGPFDGPMAWARTVDVLDTPEARAALDPATTILLPSEPAVWPSWMSYHGFSFATGELTELLTGFSPQPVPALDVVAPPESIAPPEIADLDNPDLDRFWHMWGHLYRNGRLNDAPVERSLISGSIPASTGSMLTHATRPERLPHLIPEKCTACAACWTVCPEAAIVARVFRFDEAIASSMPSGALHLPRLAPAIAKAAEKLVRGDGLWQYLTVGDTLQEAGQLVAEKAGLDDDKKNGLAGELEAVIASAGSIRMARAPGRNATVEDREMVGLAVDPDACTACGICIQTCPEQALERTDAWDAVTAWRALAALPAMATEGDTRLAGRPSGRMARSGSADRGNLNRTALRLLLESAHTHARDTYAALRSRLDDVSASLEPAMRAVLAAGTDVNAFEASARALSVDEKTAARLQALQDVKRDLSEITFKDRPHVLLLDATERRSLGLAGWPVNPFAMPYVACSPDEVPGLVAGIRAGLERSFTEVARTLRMAEQLRDDVLETTDTTDADREAANDMVPRIVVVTDSEEVRASGARVLVLTGAGPDEPAPDLGLQDPVALLAAFDTSGPAPMTVYAPDPVRDGFDTEQAVSVARLAFRSGIVPGRPGAPDTTAADWMVVQDRYAHLFTLLARRDWQPDQAPITEWFVTPDGRVPYVVHGQTRFLVHDAAAAFARAVWERATKVRETGDQIVQNPATQPPATATTTVAPPVPPAPQVEAFEILRKRLMELSRLDSLEDSP